MKTIFIILRCDSNKAIQLNFQSEVIPEFPLFLSVASNSYQYVMVNRDSDITTAYYKQIRIPNIQTFIDQNDMIRQYNN